MSTDPRPTPKFQPTPDAGPATIPFEKLDGRTIAYDSVSRWVRVAVEVVLVLLFAGLMFGLGWFTPAVRVVILLLAALGIALEVVCAVVMPRLHHKFTSFRADAQGLEIRSGVLWRSVVTVARSRIQHLDVTQGPIERNYGLGRLHVHTAGTHDATITLWGIAQETAKALRDDLGTWSTDDDGV